MKKFLSVFLSGIILVGSIQSAFAVSVNDLTDNQRKLYDRAYSKISPILAKRTDLYRKSLIKALDKKMKALTNADQKAVIEALIGTLSASDKPTDAIGVQMEKQPWAVSQFATDFERVQFLKFAVSQYEDPSASVKKVYADEALLSSSIGFTHDTSWITNFSYKRGKEDGMKNVQKKIDDYRSAIKKKSPLSCYVQSINPDDTPYVEKMESRYAINTKNELIPSSDLYKTREDGAYYESLVTKYRNSQGGTKEMINEEYKKYLTKRYNFLNTLASKGQNYDGKEVVGAFPLTVGTETAIPLVYQSSASADIYGKGIVFATKDGKRKFTALSSVQLALDGAVPFQFVAVVSEGGGASVSLLACGYDSDKNYTPVFTGEEKEILNTPDDIFAKMGQSCQSAKNSNNPNWSYGGYVDDYLNSGSIYKALELWRGSENIPPLFTGNIKFDIYKTEKMSDLEAIYKKWLLTDYCEYTVNACHSQYIGKNPKISAGSLWKRGWPSISEIEGMNIAYRYKVEDRQDQQSSVGALGMPRTKSISEDKVCVMEAVSDDGRINDRFEVSKFYTIYKWDPYTSGETYFKRIQ